MKMPLFCELFAEPCSKLRRSLQYLGILGVALCSALTVHAQNLAFSTLAGTAGVATPFNNSAPVTFNNPQGVAADSSGNVYIADTSNHVIRKIAANGAVSTLVGIPGASGLVNDATANASTARFNAPRGIAINSAGTILYVADTGNNAIRVITLASAGGAVTGVSQLAGSSTGVAGESNTGAGLFTTPIGIALNNAGDTLYVSDAGNHMVKRIVIAGPTITTVAGLAGNTVFANGNSSTATFNTPMGLALNAAEDALFVADYGNHAVRRIALSPVAVTTYAGTPGTPGFIDAAGASAAFRNPSGVAFEPSGGLYVVDFGNNALRLVATSSGNPVTTVAGPTATGGATAGAAGVQNGTGNAVRFTGPIGVATRTINSVPFVFVADTNNHLIRQGAAPALPTVGAASPATQTVSAGANGVNFTATVTGGWPAPTLQWQIQPGGVGSFQNLTASGTYQNVTTNTLTINGVSTGMNNDKFRLVATTSSAVEGAAATLLVSQPPTFANSSVTFTAVVGQPSGFTVAATGSSTITYSAGAGAFGIFSLNSNGTISGTPTATSDAVGPVTVTATNGISPDATQQVTINVVSADNAAVPVITSATAATFLVGQNNVFTFTASGAPTPTIGLSGSLPAGVSFANGILSGTPVSTTNSPFTLTVSATNSVGSATTQTFTLTVSAVSAAPTVVTQPSPAIANLGQNATFTAAITGSPTPALRWQRLAAQTSGGFADLTDDSKFSGTATGTLTIHGVEAGMSGDQFRLMGTNASGTATTNGATLTVNVGTTIGTFAGSAGQAGAADGTGSEARFNSPSSIAIDSSGNFYVADPANHIIRKVSSNGAVTTLAGMPGVSGSADGQGSAARFNAPSAVAVTSSGTVLVADTFNHTIRAITPGGSVSTLTGLAGMPGAVDGASDVARFLYPSGIAVDAAGNVYVADSLNHTIRRVSFSGSVSTFAGAAGLAGSGDNVIGTSARFNYPANLAVDSSGNLYVADSLNHLIRKVTSTGQVSTVAGLAGVAGAVDAHGTAATFNRPNGVAVDSSGNLYVADTNNHTIRKISSTGTVTTLAGTAGVPGSADGVGTQARLREPFAVAVDANGNIYIADTRNHVIRRSGTTSSPSIVTQPQNRTAPAGGSTTFTVVGAGVPAPSYQWQRQLAGTSGFTNLTNDNHHSGVTTSTLTVSNILSSQNGDQYRVVLANGINPAATSEAATLTLGEAPVFTNAAAASFRATEASSFTFAATGSPTPVFASSGLPSWLTLNPTTGVLTGTPPADAVGEHTFTVFANNGGIVSQSFTLTITPALVAPSFTSQPGNVTANVGGSATFTAAATGTPPLNYQWRRNGAAINGATGASFTVANVQPSSAGNYSVVVTNAGGSAISSAAELVVNAPPIFTTAPRTQMALAGSTVTFNAAASGGGAVFYQWRRNGVAIPGANSATLTLSNVGATDAGIYDVIANSAGGSSISSVAQLTIVTSATAPVITAQPASRTLVTGASSVLAVGATGVPAPGYQWRKNGSDIAGATGATLALNNVQAADAGAYQVVVSSSAGSVNSAVATVRVLTRSHAGVYFGTLSGGAGSFALYLREDNTGVFLGFAPVQNAPILSTAVTLDNAGTFTFAQGAVPSSIAAITVTGTVANDGTVTGTISGGLTANLTGNRVTETTTANVAGFYRAGATASSLTVYAIVGGNGQSFVLAQSGNVSDGGPGVAGAGGSVAMTTTRSAFTGSIALNTGILTGSITGAIVGTVSGGNDTGLALQRLVNISSRARVSTGESVGIAGFVISGEESKPVLIRAVGPTLAAAPFNLSGALTAPVLELSRGNVSIATNSGIGTNRAAIDAAGAQAAAFPLGAAGTDAAILITLAPGNYTAAVSSGNGNPGIALVEVYDLSAVNVGQKLLNISTRAPAGSGDNTLIAGFVVPPGTSKRVLVRGVGPGLTPFGVGGVLQQPALTLMNNNTTIAANTNWATSPDANAITTLSAQVGAFGLATNDSALIATLPPGNYTAQVTGVGGTTGVALIEVYELP